MARRFAPVSLGSPTFTTREVGAFQITHAQFPSGLELRPHVHERACVAATLVGAWDSVLGSRPHACRAATLLVEPAGDRHSNHFVEAADVLVVQPDPRRVELLAPCSRLLGAVQCFQQPAVAGLAWRLARELTATDRAAPLVVEGLALELVATAARSVAAPVPRSSRPHWIGRARERLHDGACEAVSVSDVAAEVGVHPVHLARVFRACFGVSPGEYVRRARIERAMARLTGTADPLADIAHDAGFADQSDFTRAFRRHTGLPPGAFRRTHR